MYFKCLVGYLVAYRSISISEMQNAIDERWNLEGRVIVFKKIGKYYIIRDETVSDKDDLIYAGPWNINAALLDAGAKKENGCIEESSLCLLVISLSI